MNLDRTALRGARRACGWSQSDAARRLAALARAQGSPGAAPASLKTLLSRWENGHAVPEPQYRALLGELYGRSPVELGLQPPPDAEMAGAGRLRARLAAAAAVGDAALGAWREQLGVVRRLDDELGTAGASALARTLVDELDGTLAHTIGPIRRAAIASLLAEASALAGWHALDKADPEQAWHRFDRARAAAGEAEASGACGQAAAGQASVLIEVGEAGEALALLDQVGPGRSAAARAWLGAARGAVSAAVGAARASRQAFDAAERALREDTVGHRARDDDGGPTRGNDEHPGLDDDGGHRARDAEQGVPDPGPGRVPDGGASLRPDPGAGRAVDDERSVRRKAERTLHGGPGDHAPDGADSHPASAGRGAADVVDVPGGLVIELADLHRWRGHALVALGDPAAVGPLERALAAGVRSVRHRATLHADLATALAALDRCADAAEHARAACRLAERIGSARTVALLERAPPSTGAAAQDASRLPTSSSAAP